MTKAFKLNSAFKPSGDQPEAIRRLEGIDCRGRGTSCPDQLARALREYLSKQ